MSDTRLGGDGGSMAVEVVILVPALLMVMLLVVAFGRYVTAEGDVQAAAREAVRAATLERDEASARAAAQRAADAVLPPTLACRPVVLSGAFASGGTLSVEVSCDVSWADLGMIGLSGVASVSGESAAPLDTYRRTTL